MERSTRNLVRFLHPFQLGGIEGVLPPGSYEVETVEEQLEGLSFVAYRRVTTTITVPGPTALSRQLTEIDPKDLAAALEKDTEALNGQSQI